GEQLVQLDLLRRDLMLDEVSDRGEQHGDGGDDGQQQIERQRAREEGHVVFERRLKGPPGNAGHRLMPAALGLHATGSSSSSSDVALFPPRPRRFASVRRRSAAATRSCSSSCHLASSWVTIATLISAASASGKITPARAAQSRRFCEEEE